MDQTASVGTAEVVATEQGAPLSISQGQAQKSQFLQLLVAQLKGQDPLNPMDGTQFASQLAQFSSLEELINIREVMENVNTSLQAQAADAEPGRTPFDTPPATTA